MSASKSVYFQRIWAFVKVYRFACAHFISSLYIRIHKDSFSEPSIRWKIFNSLLSLYLPGLNSTCIKSNHQKKCCHLRCSATDPLELQLQTKFELNWPMRKQVYSQLTNHRRGQHNMDAHWPYCRTAVHFCMISIMSRQLRSSYLQFAWSHEVCLSWMFPGLWLVSWSQSVTLIA